MVYFDRSCKLTENSAQLQTEWLIQLAACIPIATDCWMALLKVWELLIIIWMSYWTSAYCLHTPLSLCLLLAYALSNASFRFSVGPFASDVYCTLNGHFCWIRDKTFRYLKYCNIHFPFTLVSTQGSLETEYAFKKVFRLGKPRQWVILIWILPLSFNYPIMMLLTCDALNLHQKIPGKSLIYPPPPQPHTHTKLKLFMQNFDFGFFRLCDHL